jgi:hypothetical protein
MKKSETLLWVLVLYLLFRKNTAPSPAGLAELQAQVDGYSARLNTVESRTLSISQQLATQDAA